LSAVAENGLQGGPGLGTLNKRFSTLTLPEQLKLRRKAVEDVR
jgi:hypothetical protein